MGTEIADNGFMSTSISSEYSYFKHISNVRLEIDAPKGTHAYVTDNEEESEIILARGTKCVLNGAKIDGNYMVLAMRIVNG